MREMAAKISQCMYRKKNKDHIRHEAPITYFTCSHPERGLDATCDYDWRQNIAACPLARYRKWL